MMGDKFEIIMRDPRKAPYDVPLLVKTHDGYVTARRDSLFEDFVIVDDSGRVIFDADGCLRVDPLFYCELPK